MKKLFLMTLAVIALMTSCNKEDVKGPNPDTAQKGFGYLYLNLSGVAAASGRAAGDPTPGTGESDVQDISILLFDANNKFLDIKTPALGDFTTGSDSYQTTNAFLVPAATAKVFVVINNIATDGTTARFKLPTLADDLGKDWSALNQTLTFDPSATLDDVNKFIEQVTGTKDSKANYTMANYGVRAVGDNGLITVKLGKTAAEAKTEGAGNVVYVDRLASKVVFSTNANGVAALPTGAAFHFQGWEMNATSRKMRLYSEHDAAYTQAEVSGVKVAYRKDANFLSTSYGQDLGVWDGYAEQFVFLRNVGTDGTGATSTVASASAAVKYCPENTMEAPAQMIGGTTKVVVKGNYVPLSSKTGGTFAQDASYFTYMGEYYTLAEIKTAYAASIVDGHNQGLAKDMDDFMKAALLVTGTATESDIVTAVAALAEGTGATELNEKTGIIGREDNAVRYFHKGVSYYEVLIRHDQRISDPMALGRYGTVRNNWYDLTLNKVSKPGTPWIPGGPDSPATDPKPNTPDDVEAYLDVTIKINPWVLWTQGVEL